jgi:hypothetical protein
MAGWGVQKPINLKYVTTAHQFSATEVFMFQNAADSTCQIN